MDDNKRRYQNIKFIKNPKLLCLSATGSLYDSLYTRCAQPTVSSRLRQQWEINTNNDTHIVCVDGGRKMKSGILNTVVCRLCGHWSSDWHFSCGRCKMSLLRSLTRKVRERDVYRCKILLFTRNYKYKYHPTLFASRCLQILGEGSLRIIKQYENGNGHRDWKLKSDQSAITIKWWN